MQGVIVLAHGSRDPLWRAPVEAVAERIRLADPQTRVACAYLELSEPGLLQAAADLIAQGVTRLRVLPLFFGMGKHAREDIPVLMSELAAAHPLVHFAVLPAAGEDARLIALLAQIALETRS